VYSAQTFSGSVFMIMTWHFLSFHYLYQTPW